MWAKKTHRLEGGDLAGSLWVVELDVHHDGGLVTEHLLELLIAAVVRDVQRRRASLGLKPLLNHQVLASPELGPERCTRVMT